ncbi:MAG: phosphoglycerate dehydrogenase [Eubacteriaceae bacterium]|nr:phosphoglycerate dehydrogenase [Eubacteriaceae bacterium]
MFKIKLFNQIDEVGLARLPENFEIVETDDYDGIILRSFKMDDSQVIPSLAAVARAGAGVNNIPIIDYAEKGIVVFNTPGANANAVKELVILGALLACRQVAAGIQWLNSVDPSAVEVDKLVEEQKAQFVGPEILGKKVGVIGLGAIGVLAANAFADLGADVYGFDPFISIEHAWGLKSDIHRANSMESIFTSCDFVTLHIPFTDTTKEIINADLLSQAKQGIKILNFARAELVDDAALLEAIESGKVAVYVTDFPNNNVAGKPGVIAIPHLGASTPEAETNCAIMAADQIAEYLDSGNIINSVNYPDCTLGALTGKARLGLNHKNMPNMIGQITAVLAVGNLNIANMINKSKGEFAYTLIDIDEEFGDDIIDALEKIDGVLKVRKLG